MYQNQDVQNDMNTTDFSQYAQGPIGNKEVQQSVIMKQYNSNNSNNSNLNKVKFFII